MKQLSYSQISLYKQCPKLYEHRYIIGEPFEDNETLQFGRGVHSIFETYLKTGDKKYAKSIMEDSFGLSSTPSKSKALACHLFEEGLSLLEEEFGFNIKTTKIICIEEKIEFPQFVGVIDLAFEHEGVVIVDWKTSSSLFDAHRIKTDEQLTCYAWLYYSKYRVKPNKLCLVNLNKYTGEASLYQTERTIDDIKEWEKQFVFYTDVVDKGQFPRNPEGCFKWGRKCHHYQDCWGQTPANISEKNMPSLLT